MVPTTGQLESILAAAVEITADAERRRFVEQACAGDAELQQQVERLVANHFQAGSFLESPAPDLGLGATLGEPSGHAPPHDGPGTVIGSYKLLEQIGEGGFGVVFLADQQHPVRRRVALKVLKPGMDTRQVVARFEAERQALAIMDHPNIAKVLDGGATPSGRPYFVMELVNGVPITEFCDREHLTPRQRLELFVPVCQAVQHAHQKGIIHRDLKPSNVLVAVHDTVPVPKVIDFGVAKAVGQELTDKTLFTGLAQMIGTPLYMSPEQAGQSGLDVDTRSDVYSLGVLLYELLTGSTPFEQGRFRRAAYEEIRRIIRDEEPPRPSTRLGTSNQLAGIAASRGVEPRKLSGLVRGELDWIVMRCLEKDRGRRYETVNGLAADVGRYLADEAVHACPPSATYRLRKLTRRHRVPLAVAAGFLLLLVAGAVVSTHQAIRVRAEQGNTFAQKLEADQQRQRAERERDRAVDAEQRAVTEAGKSEHVATFMTDMLRGVGPGVARGRDTALLREILDNTTKRLDQLKGQPAVEADLRAVLGRVYYDLGDYGNAEAMQRAALALRRDLLGTKHARVASALVQLADTLRKEAQYDEAERLLAEALAMQRALLGNSHPDVGLTLLHLGMLRIRAGRGPAAEPLLRDALVIYRQHPDRDVSVVLGQLALSLGSQAKYAAAEPFARECLAMRREQAPSGDPDVAYALYNLGNLLLDWGKLEESERYARDALEMRLKLLGPTHPDTFSSRASLANSLSRRGRGEEAVPLIDECVRLARRKPEWERLADLVNLRVRHYQKAKDAAGCRASAEMWERLNRTTPISLYNAACYWAVSAAVRRAADRSPDGAMAAAAEADRALEWLGKALAAGYANAAHMMQDKDLDVLRDRVEFQKLLVGLGAKRLADLSRDVERNPADAQAYRARGTLLLQTGRAREAAADLGKVTELDPHDHAAWYQAAALYLSIGDVERYRSACREMLDRFDQLAEEKPEIAERTAKTCALAPESVPDFSRVERLADRCITGTENHGYRRFFRIAKGLTDYRAGRYKEAIKWLQPTIGGQWDGIPLAALAMAHQRLGNADEARATLESARAAITKDQPASKERMQGEILCREAEELLEQGAGRDQGATTKSSAGE